MDGQITLDSLLEMSEEYQSYWAETYRNAKSDLEFFVGGSQWDPQDVQARKDRPCIEVNVLPQFVHQVTNQIRQNTPSINVLPTTRDTSKYSAKVIKGLIREIEYRSGADAVYDTAAEYAVTSSFGFILVDHQYVPGRTDIQELVLRRVHNPLAWYLDPSSVEPDGSDAQGAVGFSEITKREFEEKYPKKPFVTFKKDAEPDDTQDTITLGHVYKATDEGIKHFICSGADILEETIFPGRYVPLIPVWGRETWVDGKRRLTSLIRNAKDPQRRYNYWASIETEILQKSPIAPFIAEAGSIEAFAEDWEDPHSSVALRYEGRRADGTPYDKPQRNQPNFAPGGVLNAMQGAYEDIKRAMGLYDASIGNRSNETSGIAIRARQQQGDTATFHFPDNLNRSIIQVGRVLLGAIPTFYDTARTLQIVGDEDEAKLVGVNGEEPVEGQPEVLNLASGQYDVRLSTGQSYATSRQEAAAFYTEIIKANPGLIEKAGDLFIEQIDMAGADKLAERLRKFMPPEIVSTEDDAPTQREVQLQQQLEQMNAQIEQMGQALQQAGSKLADKRGDAIKMRMDGEQKEAELRLKEKELMQEGRLEAAKLELEREKLQIERLKAEALLNPQFSEINQGVEPNEYRS